MPEPISKTGPNSHTFDPAPCSGTGVTPSPEPAVQAVLHAECNGLDDTSSVSMLVEGHRKRFAGGFGNADTTFARNSSSQNAVNTTSGAASARSSTAVTATADISTGQAGGTPVDAAHEWLKKLVRLEGSYSAWEANSANRDDRGGKTNFGLTFDTYKRLRPAGTEAEFKTLTATDVEKIATGLFHAYGASKLNDPAVAILIADSFWGGFDKDVLNRALVACGGKPVATQAPLNAATINELNAVEPKAFVDAYVSERRVYHQRIVAADSSQAKFLGGWDRRLQGRWIQSQIVMDSPGVAARWLNGQSMKVLNGQIALLDKDELKTLYDAAIREPGVGSASRFAQVLRHTLGITDSVGQQ
jgi:hypothetical protein